MSGQRGTGQRGPGQRGTGGSVDVEALYAAHRLTLVRLAVLLVDDRALAEDVVQDAFVALHRGQARIKDPGAALGYLRISVVNGARSTLRRRRTVRSFLSRATPPPDAAPADRDVLRAETGSAVFRAVHALPDRQREVLVLRYWSDLSERQIAEALGISEGTVKSTASRALDKLETILGEHR